MRIDALPMWAVFVGAIVVVLVAIEAGYRLGQVRHRRSDEATASPVSAIAAILGLAACRRACTCGLVAERDDARDAMAAAAGEPMTGNVGVHERTKIGGSP
jgi:hypothetical protein